jgi:hypothetical protein
MLFIELEEKIASDCLKFGKSCINLWIYELAAIPANRNLEVKNLPNDCNNHFLGLHLFKIYKEC